MAVAAYSGGGKNLKIAALSAAVFGAMTTLATAAPGPIACAGAHAPVTPLSSHHLATAKSIDAIAPAGSGVKAVRSGAWSDPATWGGRTPAGRVVIPAGVGVVFDLANSPAYLSVRVDGCLELSSQTNTRLNTEFLYVAPNGELLAGTPGSPIPPSIRTEIIFSDFGAINTSIDKSLLGKGLVAASRVRIYGALKDARVKVAMAPLKGSSVVRLASAPSGWRVGDRIVVTGTRFIPQTTSSGVVLASPTEDEVRFIRAINGAVVTLDAPLKYDHAAPYSSLGAYLVNYTRNVRMASVGGAGALNSRRAHSLYMSTETTIQGAEFFEMGRTDKSVRAADVNKLTLVRANSNIRGRYPVHLHQGGFVPEAVAPVLRNIAVWGSPGWGVTHHGGTAFLFDNNTWNTFGAGFVSESGNETGAWVGNSAIKATGVDHIVKFGPDVNAFDLGRTGDGFWLQSRSIRVHKNLAVGMTGGMGFVYFHRGNDLGSRFPLTTAFTAQNLCMSEALRFGSQAIDKPQILQFSDNEVIASEVGFHITKPSPAEPHDLRSVIDNFTAWEVVDGVDITYTSRYTVKDGLISGAASPGKKLKTGVIFGKNTYDLAVAGTKITNVDYGVDLQKQWSTTFAPSFAYAVAGAQFSNVKIATYRNRNSADQVFTTLPTVKPTTLTFKWGTAPALPTSSQYLLIEGVKKDGLGTIAYPLAPKELLVGWSNHISLSRARGWYDLTTGSRGLVYPEYYSDRLTGELFQTSFIYKMTAPGFPWPSRLTNGAAAYQGTLDPNAAAPTANNDTASVNAGGSVRIRVFANDSSNDGKLLPAGHTTARNGAAEQRANGDFIYTPYPGFTGTDKFNYWVRNRQGVVSRASVTVTVY